MNLPAHYTVAEVIEALEVRLDQEKELTRLAKIKVEEFENGEVVNALPFGLFGWTKIKKPDFWDNCWFYDFGVTFGDVDGVKEQLAALHKLPLDAKVKLTVKEINDLFNKPKETT